jgi:hypothetical protein
MGRGDRRSLPGSPIIGGPDAIERVTVFLVPVSKWSDGTAESHDRNRQLIGDFG